MVANPNTCIFIFYFFILFVCFKPIYNLALCKALPLLGLIVLLDICPLYIYLLGGYLKITKKRF